MRAHVRLRTSAGFHGTRTLLHPIFESPNIDSTTESSHELAETLRPLLAASNTWDVYIDGSWYPTAVSAETFLGEKGSHTGGCAIIFAPAGSSLHAGVVALRMDSQNLSVVHEGGPRMMKLIGVTVGIILHHKLAKRSLFTQITKAWSANLFTQINVGYDALD